MPLGKNGKKHLVLSGAVTDFHSQPIVNVDLAPGVEFLTMDPGSPLLNQQYQSLIREVKAIVTKNPEMDVINKLNCVTRFVHHTLGGKGTDTLVKNVDKEFVDANAKNHELINGHPIMSIDEFIVHGKGVCRHRMMLGAYLVDRLKVDGLLPPGDVRTQVDNFDANLQLCHAWLTYKTKATNQLFLIDSMWFEVAHDITDGKNILALGYNEKIKQRIMARNLDKPADDRHNPNIKLIAPVIPSLNAENTQPTIESPNGYFDKYRKVINTVNLSSNPMATTHFFSSILDREFRNYIGDKNDALKIMTFTSQHSLINKPITPITIEIPKPTPFSIPAELLKKIVKVKPSLFKPEDIKPILAPITEENSAPTCKPKLI